MRIASPLPVCTHMGRGVGGEGQKIELEPQGSYVVQGSRRSTLGANSTEFLCLKQLS